MEGILDSRDSFDLSPNVIRIRLNWSAFERGLCPRNPLPGGGIGRGAEPPPEQLGQALFGAGAVQLLVGRNAGHDLDDAPLTACLAGLASLPDPHVLERLAVARAPPLLAVVVVVLAADPQRSEE